MINNSISRGGTLRPKSTTHGCDNHIRNEEFVTSRSIGRFSIKQECTHTKHSNIRSKVKVKLLQLMFIIYKIE
jgi:hypothetical protein